MGDRRRLPIPASRGWLRCLHPLHHARPAAPPHPLHPATGNAVHFLCMTASCATDSASPSPASQASAGDPITCILRVRRRAHPLQPARLAEAPPIPSIQGSPWFIPAQPHRRHARDPDLPAPADPTSLSCPVSIAQAPPQIMECSQSEKNHVHQ